MLSDGQILEYIHTGKIGFTGYDKLRIQPSQLEVTLFPLLKIFKGAVIDPRHPQEDSFEDRRPRAQREDPEVMWLLPGEFALGATNEILTLPADLTAKLDGKSSLARLGLLCHHTGGVIDAGFNGSITLEFHSTTSVPFKLFPGMPIGQLSFHRLEQPALEPYAGKYNGQGGPTVSRYHQNWNSANSTWK